MFFEKMWSELGLEFEQKKTKQPYVWPHPQLDVNMDFINTIKEKTEYIGDFTVTDTNIDFARKEGLRRKHLIEMGDVVYFMFVSNTLMKIGKAGGATGFANRIGTYSQGITGDQTNKRIIRVMNKINESKIEVYVLRAPRKNITIECSLTNSTIVENIPINGNLETYYTKMYLGLSNENSLPFCGQIT